MTDKQESDIDYMKKELHEIRYVIIISTFSVPMAGLLAMGYNFESSKNRLVAASDKKENLISYPKTEVSHFSKGFAQCPVIAF